MDGERSFTALPAICRLSTATRRPCAGVFAPRRRIRNCNGRSFGGDVYLKQHAVSRHNVTRKMGGRGRENRGPVCRGMISGGLGDERARASQRVRERKNEAPLDCARQRRINPLAGARRGFCARRRRADVNVKRSSRAVGKDSHARIKTRWPLKYDAFLHPAQFDSVHSVEGHWVFFLCWSFKGPSENTHSWNFITSVCDTHEQFCLICYCLQSLLCVILSSSSLRLSSKSLPHCTARRFIFLAVTVFPELYERKCS